MAQQTCLARGALTVETAHPVDARSTVEASSSLTVVDVLRAVLPCPAVDANAGISSRGVGTCSPIVTYRRTQGALVYVLLAELPAVGGGTEAPVAVHVV